MGRYCAEAQASACIYLHLEMLMHFCSAIIAVVCYYNASAFRVKHQGHFLHKAGYTTSAMSSSASPQQIRYRWQMQTIGHHAADRDGRCRL